MTAPRWRLPAVLGAALLVLGWLLWSVQRDRRDTGAAAVDRATVTRTDSTLRRLREDSARLAGRYTVDAVTLHHALVVVDTTHRALVLTDTVRVRAALTADSVALRACTAALETAGERLSVCDATAVALRTQRDAWRRVAERPAPRLTPYAAALWSPVGAAPVARVGVTLRVAGPVQLLAEGEQTFAPHESPRVLVGARVRF